MKLKKEKGDTEGLSKSDLEDMVAENERTLTDFTSVLPTKLLGMARKAKSDAFPDGFAHTAVEKVLVEITAKDGDENELQDEFGNGRCRSGTDPRDCIKKLQDLQEKLEQRHKIIKTDDDIIHQVLEVIGSK